MEKLLKKLKKMLNLYNLGILVCVVLIIISLIILLEPKVKLPKIELPKISVDFNKKDGVKEKITIVESNVKNDDSITEEDAIKLAISQFKKIGETDLNEKDVTSTEIERNGEHFYYICSPQNTLEIKIIGGKITRLNSVPVDNL